MTRILIEAGSRIEPPTVADWPFPYRVEKPDRGHITMPQLPSGRHIAIGTDSLNGLLEAVAAGFRVNELMSINKPERLSSYLDLYYFRPAEPGETAVEYTDAALTPPDGFIPYRSGHTLASIHTEWDHWPAEDRQAFVEFLGEPRFSDYLNSLFKYIEEYKRTLRESGPFAARVQTHWWDAGCHPLQPGGEDPD